MTSQDLLSFNESNFPREGRSRSRRHHNGSFGSHNSEVIHWLSNGIEFKEDYVNELLERWKSQENLNELFPLDKIDPKLNVERITPCQDKMNIPTHCPTISMVPVEFHWHHRILGGVDTVALLHLCKIPNRIKFVAYTDIDYVNDITPRQSRLSFDRILEVETGILDFIRERLSSWKWKSRIVIPERTFGVRLRCTQYVGPTGVFESSVSLEEAIWKNPDVNTVLSRKEEALVMDDAADRFSISDEVELYRFYVQDNASVVAKFPDDKSIRSVSSGDPRVLRWKLLIQLTGLRNFLRGLIRRNSRLCFRRSVRLKPQMKRAEHWKISWSFC
jgi:hypothetical protein